MSIANYDIPSSNSEESLGVVTDSGVIFAKHIENLCWKTNQKLQALARVLSGHVLEHRYNRNNNFGVKSVSTLGAKIWALVPENLKQLTSMNSFKPGIKKGNPSNCPCSLCTT